MAQTVKLKFKIESWDEKPYRELDDGRKFTRADVALTGPAEELSDATFEGLMYYRPDGTSSYVTLMHLGGALNGRSGSFVLQGQGTYDGTTARGESVIVEGSGTGDLTGITGTAASSSTHADYPYMPLSLTYVLD